MILDMNFAFNSKFRSQEGRRRWTDPSMLRLAGYRQVFVNAVVEIVANNIDGNCSDDSNRNNFCWSIVDGVVMTVAVL